MEIANSESGQYPLVTFAVINFNGLSYLQEMIPRLLEINYINCEWLVVDNGSQDGSIEYLEHYSRVKLIKNPVLGSKNHGLNLILEQAAGQYICFLDCDIVLDPYIDVLELIRRASRPETGLLSMALQNRGEDTVKFYGLFLSYLSIIKRNERLSIKEVQSIDDCLVVGVQGAAFFAKAERFTELGTFDESVPFGGEDLDLGLRSLLLGYKNHLYSKEISLHIGMEERTNLSKMLKKYYPAHYGLFLTIFKNFSLEHVLFMLAGYLPYSFLKLLKDSLSYRTTSLFPLYGKILINLVKNRQKIALMRNAIQAKRHLKRDEFFEIHAPLN